MPNSWNTPVPPLGDITELARVFAEAGYDTHTVTVTLDNGGWAVTLGATDADLDDHAFHYVLNHHGILTPDLRQDTPR